ncbi:hypothetical protein VNO77_21609 [Canavalia gladiata]|uniref:Uncharacterized protein n=1 Tax=Canavalia gladiata TaxID=3824 RepID=A0AAN9QMG9_CANGL
MLLFSCWSYHLFDEGEESCLSKMLYFFSLLCFFTTLRSFNSLKIKTLSEVNPTNVDFKATIYDHSSSSLEHRICHKTPTTPSLKWSTHS